MTPDFDITFAAEPLDIVGEMLSRYESQRAVDAASLSWLMPLMAAPLLADDAFAAQKRANLLDDWSGAEDILAAFDGPSDFNAVADVSPIREFVLTEAHLSLVEAIDLLGGPPDLSTSEDGSLFTNTQSSEPLFGDLFAAEPPASFTSATDQLALLEVFEDDLEGMGVSILLGDGLIHNLVGVWVVENEQSIMNIQPLDGDFA